MRAIDRVYESFTVRENERQGEEPGRPKIIIFQGKNLDFLLQNLRFSVKMKRTETPQDEQIPSRVACEARTDCYTDPDLDSSEGRERGAVSPQLRVIEHQPGQQRDVERQHLLAPKSSSFRGRILIYA